MLRIISTRALTALKAQATQAHRDPLTSLSNRAGMNAYLASQHQRAVLRVALFDLNGLKKANDTLGHAAGDSMICTAAAALNIAARPYALAVRLGGDEFALISPLHHHSIEEWLDLTHLAAQMMGGCVGYSQGTPANWSATLAEADADLYTAKRSHYAAMELAPLSYYQLEAAADPFKESSTES